MGSAIGVFFAFITPIAQIPLSAAVAVALRANVPSAVVATFVNTPPTFGPVYNAAWYVGSKVLDEPIDDEHAPAVLAAAAAVAASLPHSRALVQHQRQHGARAGVAQQRSGDRGAPAAAVAGVDQQQRPARNGDAGP